MNQRSKKNNWEKALEPQTSPFQKKTKKNFFWKINQNILIHVCALSMKKRFCFQNKWSLKSRKNFFYSPPPPKNSQKKQKKIPQKGEHYFSFFELFAAEFSHFLVTKNVFCHQKVTKLCSENFEKRKKVSPFCGIFFLFGGQKKNISSTQQTLT